MIKSMIADIREKTAGMDRKGACAYILTYYWYHLLGIVSIIALILLFGGHYLFGNTKPVFTCVMVNQKIDTERDDRLTEAFSEFSEIAAEQIVVNSNYNFSYGDMQLTGVNESSYDKFFLQWRNNELDAVIMAESFYLYCKEMGGEFRSLDDWDTGDYETYTDGGEVKAIVLGTDRYTEKVMGKDDEKLLLAFPENGEHEAASRLFMTYVKGDSDFNEFFQ